MRVLIVKTSSLGDVIHTLPAVTDAARALPNIRFDWIVEEAFAEIPAWHPAVDRVLPVALRRWRKHPLAARRSGEWNRFREQLARQRYDVVIDAQGLLKSAWLTRYVRHAPIHGLDRNSAREPLASLFYRHRHRVAREQHAVARVRQLFAATLNYPLPAQQLNTIDYGLDRRRLPALENSAPYLVFLHGTTWPTKHWPQIYWQHLIELATADGWQVRLPWGSNAEHQRARQLAETTAATTVLPRLDLTGMAAQLAGATACVAVDTGLGHLAAAFDVPTISLFGPTDPKLTGAWGNAQRHLVTDFPCAPCLRKTCNYRPQPGEHFAADEQPPCFTRLTPEQVWQETRALIARSTGEL